MGLSISQPSDETKQWGAYDVNDDDSQTFGPDLNWCIVYCVAATQCAKEKK